MDAERLERMITALLDRPDLTSDAKVMMVQALCDEYRAWANRQQW